jgi:hypothetical protein
VGRPVSAPPTAGRDLYRGGTRGRGTERLTCSVAAAPHPGPCARVGLRLSKPPGSSCPLRRALSAWPGWARCDAADGWRDLLWGGTGWVTCCVTVAAAPHPGQCALVSLSDPSPAPCVALRPRGPAGPAVTPPTAGVTYFGGDWMGTCCVAAALHTGQCVWVGIPEPSPAPPRRAASLMSYSAPLVLLFDSHLIWQLIAERITLQ